MKITMIQSAPTWADAEASLARVEQMIAASPTSDVYVLPEMFATGFCMQPERIAQPEGGTVLTAMKRLSAHYNAAIVGSVAVADGGKSYNRMYFVRPDGTVDHYDKRHLFTYSGEHERYSAGVERCIVDYGGVRFLLQVCYDLRFPVWSRNRGDYDAIIYVASWPVARISAWDALLPARAIENQCYVVGVNRTGNDPACSYCGHSIAIDPRGNVMARCDDDCETVQSVDIDIESLRRFRAKFPVIADADPFTIVIK
ncbi:MAG: amidohydrolase [Candidatus Limisoma sp.]